MGRGVTVAITGATGMLGSHIALALRAGGASARGVARRPAHALLEAAGVALVRADLAEPEALAAAFAGAEAVVANAALGSWKGSLEDMRRTNVLGTEHTLRAAAAAGARRVIYISTVGIYDTDLYRPMTEDQRRYGTRKRWFAWSHLATDWRYSVTKLAAEERAWALADELGLKLTALRPGPIYGARDHNWTAWLLRRVAWPVVPAPTAGLPAVWAGDVASAVLGALDNPASAGRAYNLAGPPERLSRILAEVKARRGGGLIVPIPVPAWVAYDTSAAARDLGFRPTPLGAGLDAALSEP